MSNTKVYGFCDAGCKNRVPTYNEFLKSAAYVRVPLPEATLGMQTYKAIGEENLPAVKYKLHGSETLKPQITFYYKDNGAVKTLVLTNSDLNIPYDYLLKGYYFFEFIRCVISEDNKSMQIVYLMHNDDYTRTIDGTDLSTTYNDGVNYPYLEFSGLSKLYRVNDCAEITAVDGTGIYPTKATLVTSGTGTVAKSAITTPESREPMEGDFLSDNNGTFGVITAISGTTITYAFHMQITGGMAETAVDEKIDEAIAEAITDTLNTAV